MNPTDRDVPQAIDAFTAEVGREVDAHLKRVLSDITHQLQNSQAAWRSDLERAAADVRVACERAIASRIAAMRQEHAREIEATLEAERTQHGRDLEARLLALRNELSGRASTDAQAAEMDSRLAEARVEWQSDFDMRLASERAMFEATIASLKYELREDQIEASGRLLESVRRLDDQTSLRGIFEALARAAAAEASRVIIFVVDGDHLRPWGHYGFANDQTPTDLAIGSSGVMAAAVALRQPSFVSPVVDGLEPTTPAFMRQPPGGVGLLVPLEVGGDVVAVLYADGTERRPGEDTASSWAEQVELLARHAALRLENITSLRAVEGLGKS